MSVAIHFESLSKQYRLGEVGTGTLSHDLHRIWARLCGHPDPFAKVGTTNNREEVSGEYVWALKDITFSVQQGEILGIIGRNGAGKSTLLKLLSRVTAPTAGSIKAKGRIASLLEVGTGFHPELTGRENIYLNGAILGMQRHEITKQLDAIVEFSGCAKYIDTPVKRYSSGMTVRLGFAVAAHLECEILVVDEVLAVGDAEFQKKCIGKMRDIASGRGKTILFVSHNLGSMSQLCNQCIILREGTLTTKCGVDLAIRQYLKNDATAAVQFPEALNTPVTFVSAWLTDQSGNISDSFAYHEEIRINFLVDANAAIPSVEVALRVSTSDGTIAFTTQRSEFVREQLMGGRSHFQVSVPSKFLTPGSYNIDFASYIHNQQMFDRRESAVTFVVNETGTPFSQYDGQNYGIVFCPCNWQQVQVEAKWSPFDDNESQFHDE